VEVRPIPGLEHLPYAEVWLHEAGDEPWREASAAALALGKTGLEAWTTTKTPDVVAFLLERGHEEHRRYVISRLDVAAATDPGEPALPLVTLAERPDLADELYALARVAHADQPGRAGTRVGESWFEWGLRAPCADAYFIALDDGRVAGYGYLEEADGTWRHGFTAVARSHRGRGIAGTIKRAQIRFAKLNGIAFLETANELRVPMLGLSRRLGYERLYDEVVLRGPLAS
jgi:GNAT superfamily N-acetyltransferase